MKKIVIVGGGFAGLRVARILSKHVNKFEVTLISDSTTFRYSPTLYRSATGFRRSESIISLKYIVGDYPNLNLVHDRAEKIDRSKKIIITQHGKQIHYDIAVLNLGVVTSYFGIPGLEQYSFNIKTPEGLKKLKDHLHDTLMRDHEPDANYVIVGGGPTGVELSAAMSTYLKRIVRKHKTKKRAIHLELVEASPKVLPVMGPQVSKKTAKRLRKLKIKLLLGEAVKAETEETLKLADRSIPTKTVVWTAGVTNNPFFKNNPDQFELNERGKVVVNENMMIDEHVFVLGDNAGTKYGGLAQTAIRDANYAANAILTLQKGRKLKTYNQKRPISVVPVGKCWSVLQYKDFTMTGKIPNMLRSFADLVGYTDVMGLKKAMVIWLNQNKAEEDCDICK